MTYQVGLAIECNNQQAATQVADYFINWVANNPNNFLTKVNSHQDCENNWWVTVYHKYDLTLSNLTYLYEALQQSHCDYRYALAGVEVDEFRTYSEIIEDLPNLTIEGLVVSTKLAKGLNWEYFAAGYIWQPYKFLHNLVN